MIKKILRVSAIIIGVFALLVGLLAIYIYRTNDRNIHQESISIENPIQVDTRSLPAIVKSLQSASELKPYIKGLSLSSFNGTAVVQDGQLKWETIDFIFFKRHFSRSTADARIQVASFTLSLTDNSVGTLIYTDTHSQINPTVTMGALQKTGTQIKSANKLLEQFIDEQAPENVRVMLRWVDGDDYFSAFESADVGIFMIYRNDKWVDR